MAPVTHLTGEVRVVTASGAILSGIVRGPRKKNATVKASALAKKSAVAAIFNFQAGRENAMERRGPGRELRGLLSRLEEIVLVPQLTNWCGQPSF